MSFGKKETRGFSGKRVKLLCKLQSLFEIMIIDKVVLLDSNLVADDDINRLLSENWGLHLFS